MAISIDDFRKSLNIGLSRDLVQQILTKYENFDFSSVNTNNGSKLREIDAFDKENITPINPDDLKYFLNIRLKTDYLKTIGQLAEAKEASEEKRKEIITNATKVVKNSLYSRPNALTISSKDILNNPQRDESSHLLVINTDASSIVSIVNSLYEQFSKLDIPFEIEIPKTNAMNSGTTEPIKLHVTTMDLENTINVINKLDKVYKDKIKKPSMFVANVQNTFGYDSLIDINGTRSSDILGTTIVKAIDATLVDLAKDKLIDDMSVVDYLKNASNKDEARQKVIKSVKVDYPNIIEPILLAAVKIIDEDKLPINSNQVFISEMADSELNTEFGVIEEEITNVNEIVEENEETKTNDVINEAVAAVDANTKSNIISIKDLFANQFIQPAIAFGSQTVEKTNEESTNLEPSDLLKVENPTVTVIEPVPKAEELQELTEKKIDTLNEDIKPIFTGQEETQNFVLPGEETFVQNSTPVNEVTVEPNINNSIEEPVQETIPSVVEPANEEPQVIEPQMIEQPTEQISAQVDLPVIPNITELEKNSNTVEEQLVQPTPEVAPVPEIIEQPVEANVVSPVVAPTIDTTPIVVQPEIVTTNAQVAEPQAVVPTIETSVQQPVVEDLEKTQVIAAVQEPTTIPVKDLPTGIKEVITPQVNPVPDFVKQSEDIFAPTKEENELQQEIDTALQTVQNAEVDTRTIEIPTEEIKDEKDDILSAISSNLDIPDSSKLSTEEKISMVADSFTKAPAIDPAKQAIINKYNGVFIDNQVLDFRVKDENNEDILKADGTPYTFLDYLEQNNVLEKIKLDSKYYIKDNPNKDFVDGKNFIREFVISNAVNGNRSIDEIIDWYVSKTVDLNEQPKKKGLFGFGKK